MRYSSFIGNLKPINMKYLFLITVLLVILSCKKNKEHCWKCSTIIAYSNNTQENKKDTVCGKTEDEIRSYEKSNSFTVATGPTSSAKYTTVCSIQ